MSREKKVTNELDKIKKARFNNQRIKYNKDKVVRKR